VQKCNKTDATWQYARARIAMAKQSFCCGKRTLAYGHIRRVPSRAESHSARLVLNGDNMLGLCDPVICYSFYPPSSDVLFSNYFEEDLLVVL